MFCGQVVPLVLCSTKVHYRVHRIQMNPEIEFILSWDVMLCDSVLSIGTSCSVAPASSTFRVKSIAVESHRQPHNLFL
jgi:NAD-dependent SIR2 family protein deacetylase